MRWAEISNGRMYINLDNVTHVQYLKNTEVKVWFSGGGSIVLSPPEADDFICGLDDDIESEGNALAKRNR